MTPLSADTGAMAPWLRPWWWCAPGESMTLGWILGLHLAAVAGIIATLFGLLPLPGWPVFAIAGALLFLGGLGTTVAYHRALAHRAVRLNPIVEQVLIACAMANGSGNPRNWVAMHRLHHATSDRPDDISSPHQGGFWWAHLRWLWQADTRRAQDLVRDLDRRRYRWWGAIQVPVLALSVAGGLLAAPWGLEAVAAALWIGPLRLIWALHAQCTVNSICHFGAVEDAHGSGQNVVWLAPVHMFQGENWHANHHRRQTDVRLGHGAQLDLGWWTILGLKTVGLAGNLRRPTATPPPSP
jgi:fatty-acid desaturase